MGKYLSGMFSRQFKWPSRKFFNWYAIIAGAFALACGIDQFVHAAERGMPGKAFVGALAITLCMGIFAAVFYVLGAMYYRLFSEIYAGWLKFKAWVPGAVAEAKKVPAAFGRGLASLGSGIAAVFRFIISVKDMTGRERMALLAATGAVGIMLTTYWLMWPYASRLLSGTMFDDFGLKLVVDVLLSMVVLVVALPVWTMSTKFIADRFFPAAKK